MSTEEIFREPNQKPVEWIEEYNELAKKEKERK